MISESDIQSTGAWLRTKLEHMLDTIDQEAKHPSLPFGLKRCSTCQQVKTIESFYRFHRSRDGRLGRCKSCFLNKRKEATKRESVGGRSGRSVPLPVTTEDELRAALQTGKVFRA